MPDASEPIRSRDGILDFLSWHSQNEVITPFQRLMQFPPMTAIYEKYWRPLGFLVASSSSFREFSAGLIQRLEPQKRSSILDLACGPGLFACPLAAQTSGWVIGFDLSLPMLRRAHKKAFSLWDFEISSSSEEAHSTFPSRTTPWMPFSVVAHCICSISPRPRWLKLHERCRVRVASCVRPLSNRRYSAGLASFLDRVIRFGFFESIEDLNEKLGRAGIRVEEQWGRRIIHAFQARRV